jgi:hypothetical protein
VTRRRGPEDLPAGHVIARVLLGVLVVLLSLAALSAVVLWRGDELALARTVTDAVRSAVLP